MESEREILGFAAPLHRSLTDPILLGGAPRSYAIVVGTLAAALGLGLQQWLAGLCVWLVGQGLGVLLARRDPQFLEVLVRHVRQKAWRS